MNLLRAQSLDQQVFGRSGKYLSRDFGFPQKGWIISDHTREGIIIESVTFVGNYTFDTSPVDIPEDNDPEITFHDASVYDQAVYGDSGSYWKLAYGNPEVGQIIIITSYGDIKIMRITFVGKFTLQMESKGKNESEDGNEEASLPILKNDYLETSYNQTNSVELGRN